MKSRRSKKTDISQKVKKIVWERDGHRCIICGSNRAMPNAHYISRAYGGLGIEQNVVTLCMQCHHDMDQSPLRKELTEAVKAHLDNHYPGFPDEERKYRKYAD